MDIRRSGMVRIYLFGAGDQHQVGLGEIHVVQVVGEAQRTLDYHLRKVTENALKSPRQMSHRGGVRRMDGHNEELAFEQLDMLISIDDPGAFHGAEIAIGKTAQAEYLRQVA